MKNLPNRKSPRLNDYDYSQAGAYFVTICTHQRTHLFGRIMEGTVSLNAAGEIAAACWLSLPDHHAGIELDAFVVMPNHVHGIIVLLGTTQTPSELVVSAEGTLAKTDAAGRVPTGVSLGIVIRSYKSGVTRRVREAVNEPSLQVWQSRYHDHIIRSEISLHAIQAYVLDNPMRWQEDTFFAP